ncbi:MAG: hypothetical protein MUO99_05230, partial [Dehalococcoidales bacterium]|nr:hypothetical protein [Dehalococcoidales bacterium]
FESTRTCKPGGYAGFEVVEASLQAHIKASTRDLLTEGRKMSKLTIRLRTQGKAVAALLKLYKADPDFAQELEKLRTNYLPVLEQWLKIAVPDWVKMKKAREFVIIYSKGR